MSQSELRIVKHKRSFLIVAGKSPLWKGKTEFGARLFLDNNRKILEYWAGSASVSIDNSEWVTVEL